MATTLDGVTLPTPQASADGDRETVVDAGAEMIMADGSRRFHYFGSRRRFALRWAGLTEAQKDALWLSYWGALSGSVPYSPQDTDQLYTVLVATGSWDVTSQLIGDGTLRYNVAFTLEETKPHAPSLGVRVSEAVTLAEANAMYLLSIFVSEAIGVSESVDVDLLSPAVSEEIAVIESLTVTVT